jgi:membrane associated rhomboid family serine protease
VSIAKNNFMARWNPAVLDQNRLFYAMWSTMLFLILIWGVFWINEVYALNLRRFGNHPGKWNDWSGLFTFPFLHGDLEHLWNNTATFFTLNGMLFYFYRSIALRVWALLYLSSGLGLWLFASGGNHIGASGLIYALAAFLFVSGVIRDSKLLLRISLVVAFLYGGMVWWMLPVDGHISWEGHLSGAISGLITALLFRNSGPLPDLPIFREDDSIEPLPEWWALAHPDHPEVLAMREAEEKSGNLSAHATSGDSPRVVYRIQKKDE